MTLDELNQNQKNQMKRNLTKDYYEWNDKNLFSYLNGELPQERGNYRYSGKELSKTEIEQNKLINNINEILKKYNSTMIINEEELNKLEKYYVELDKYKERFYTLYNEVKNRLKFNKVVWISGPGGIGKSQFLYEFSEQLNSKCNSLCIYGKYCKEIKNTVLNEIKNILKSNKFYFIIDAINELDNSVKKKIIKFIKENKNNQNLRIIISYRDFSMNQLEVENIKQIVDEEEIFSGVSPENALEKISEKYNLDLSIYSRLLYDNNPLHLKLIIKTISKNQLTNNRLNSITKGTYIYEQFIKEVLSKQDWNTTKEIVKRMFKNKSKNIKITEIKNINSINIEPYISKMKTNNFIGTYDFENEIYLYFINETLTDYLIARFLFEEMKDLDIDNTITYIDEMLKVFYSIHSQIIMLLFEKYSKNIEIAIKIIKDSNLNHYFNIDIFNEINLNEKNIKKIQKYLHLNRQIKNIFVLAGGNENNPFNCKNYLNYKYKKIYRNKQIEYDSYDIAKMRSKLKVYVQTISKFDYNDEYIEEKFWFAVWCSATIDKVNRALSKKLIFEISNNNFKYIDILMSLYDETEDEYIKEMIIQVLSSNKRNTKKIKNFLTRINTKEELNIKNIYFISTYLYNCENYEKFVKVNLMNYADKRKNKVVLNFLHRIFFTFKYDYDFFGFDSYNSSIRFSTKFIKENKKRIININNYIAKNFNCLNIEECNSNYFKELIIDNKFKIDEDYIPDDILYLAWQKIFKQYLKKYKIKIKELNEVHVYEEKEKGLVFKALELSFSKINGSITCNYYTNEFYLYNKYKGYQFNWYDKYNEKEQIYYPVSVFNSQIEALDNRIVKKIVLPEKKNIKWVKDSEMNLDNIKRIMEPINYNNEEWCLIYGNIRLHEKSNNKYGNEWIDTYILNLAIDEDYNLSRSSEEDRKYTIETQKYIGNIYNYRLENYNMTTSLHSSSGFSDIYVTTDFNLPPTSIIKEFNLHYNKFTSSWNNVKDEMVVLVNNNEGIWYDSGCTGSLYLKKKYYDKLLKNHSFKYFCFTEKFHPNTGYCADSALQIQINEDKTITKYKHYKSKKYLKKERECCKKCMVYKVEKKEQKKLKLEDLLIDDIIEKYSVGE